MPPIPFTQYLLPVGRRQNITIDRSADVEGIAAKLEARGIRFEVELLRTGDVSLEALGPEDERGDRRCYAFELVPNGPGVPEAVDRLVRAAALEAGEIN